jgi:hypothetical protein
MQVQNGLLRQQQRIPNSLQVSAAREHGLIAFKGMAEAHASHRIIVDACSLATVLAAFYVVDVATVARLI